jgi:hypothetical protein
VILGAAILMAQAPTYSEIGPLMAAAGQAMDRWKVCAATATRKYALATTEPAATVVEAAIGECVGDYQAAATILRSGTGDALITNDTANSILKTLIDTWRPQFLAAVLRLRTASPRPTK